jgi:ABC-type transport system substrate-binding protein
MLALDLGKLDVIEIAPELARTQEGRRIVSSPPVELVALVFSRDQSAAEGRLREALAMSIDRSSLNNVLLQGSGEPAGGLLPNWLTGYSFLFPASSNLNRARQLSTGSRPAAPWRLTYDSADPLARLIAERISLTARDAGLGLQPVVTGPGDLQLVRVPLASLDARTALASVAEQLGLPAPKFAGDSAEDLYATESALLQSGRVIPLLFLRTSYGLGSSVRNWKVAGMGSWDLPDLWLAAEKP